MGTDRKDSREMNYAIVLSGGTGTRTGADMPKQYIKVNGYMMVTYAMKPILSSEHIDKVYIVCADEWKEDIKMDAKEARLNVNKIEGFAKPGDTRQLSILNGLERIIEEAGKRDEIKGRSDNDVHAGDTVLIHDAARPFLTEGQIGRCYDAIKDNDGVMPVLPMKDTVYLSNDGKNISGLIDRSTVFAGQAPELFRLERYYEANVRLLPDEIYKINGASEPAVMAGLKIAMIPGDEKNCKITTAEDLERFLREDH